MPTTPCGASAASAALVDREVLDAFQRRDPSAVRALYRAYGQLVYAVAHRVLGQRELAEEAAQQTFVQAWRAADRIDTIRDPAPWLVTIAKRAAIDVLRREARRPTRPLDEIAEHDPVLATASFDIETLDAVWQVREAIESLPADEATIVRLQHLDGMTHHQIADKLGIALGTVKSRSHRAHGKLAAVLGHLRSHSHD